MQSIDFPWRHIHNYIVTDSDEQIWKKIWFEKIIKKLRLGTWSSCSTQLCKSRQVDDDHDEKNSEHKVLDKTLALNERSHILADNGSDLATHHT